MLLGLLSISPTGTLTINDLTGSIALDLTHAKAIPEDGAWFTPGMMVLVDGTYEEDETGASSRLGGNGGVGGTISGTFIGFFIGHSSLRAPSCLLLAQQVKEIPQLVVASAGWTSLA
ncbi:hypothetical protein DID88_005537 [Monilinia fructigena]|uniref:Uncharacterized protein n=1 Tax=Monilinia fructigena TaxID=38457 RepID=A0A395J192_9HELO|nr:hypothetical protein DID88_005537 [Monilinia fructigena]